MEVHFIIMKKCLLLLSIFITLSSGIPNSALEIGIPKFTLLEERSENVNPTVMITFPNGHDDKMVLNKYYVNAEEEERIGVAEHCNFIGHLEQDLDACVAMTGCPGIDDLDFTIMSKLLPNTSFKWRKDGQVEVSPISGLPHVAHQASEDDNDAHPESKEQEELEFAIENFCWNGWGWSCPKNPSRPGGGGGSNPRPKPDQTTHLLNYKIAYDDNFKARNYQHQLNSVMTHVQARLCHHTLGQKYQLRKVGEKHVPGQRWVNKWKYIDYMAAQTRSYVGSAQVVMYCGVQVPSGDIGGEAYTGSICKGDRGKYCQMCYVDWQGMAAFAHCIAHELGHFLGAKHDKPGNCDKQGIMGGNPNQWSSCSQKDIRAHYVAYKHKWCMSAAPSACGGTGR